METKLLEINYLGWTMHFLRGVAWRASSIWVDFGFDFLAFSNCRKRRTPRRGQKSSCANYKNSFDFAFFLWCLAFPLQAFFKFVPLEYGIPALAGLVVILQIQSQIKTLRQKKIENMDDTDIDDLALELEGEDDAAESKKKAEDLKIQKKKARLAERLAAEARKAEKAAKRGSKKKNEEEDDDGDVAIFAKGSRKQKKK